MNNLARIYNHFHDALLTRDTTHALPDIKPNPRIPPEQQLAIYINGYRARLLATIRTDYPALLALLDDEQFNTIARAYIESHPPTHFNLDRYPHGFAPFFLTQSQSDFAHDLARLECAIAEVFMLPDSPALDATRLTHLTPESFGNLVLHPRTAHQLLALDHDADQYLRNATTLTAPIHLCLVRHENEVKRHRLTPASYRFLTHLFNAQPITIAFESAIAAHPADEPKIATHLQEWFTHWLQSGFFQDNPI